MSTPQGQATSRATLELVSYAFVFIWASGYVVARYGLPYAEPLTFLTLRYALVIVMMLVLAVVARAPWPESPRQAGHIAVAGVLMHAGYLGGVWCAINLGMPAGVAAIIVNTQPILTAVAGRLVGERVRAVQWVGLGWAWPAWRWWWPTRSAWPASRPSRWRWRCSPSWP